MSRLPVLHGSLVVVIALTIVLGAYCSLEFSSPIHKNPDVSQRANRWAQHLLMRVAGQGCTPTQAEMLSMVRGQKRVLLWNMECQDSDGRFHTFVRWNASSGDLVALEHDDGNGNLHGIRGTARLPLSSVEAGRSGLHWLHLLELDRSNIAWQLVHTPTRSGRLWRMTAETPARHFNLAIDAFSGQLVSLESSY